MVNLYYLAYNYHNFLIENYFSNRHKYLKSALKTVFKNGINSKKEKKPSGSFGKKLSHI